MWIPYLFVTVLVVLNLVYSIMLLNTEDNLKKLKILVFALIADILLFSMAFYYNLQSTQ